MSHLAELESHSIFLLRGAFHDSERNVTRKLRTKGFK
jgi:hypothetical protein